MPSPAQLKSDTWRRGSTPFWNFRVFDIHGQPVDMTVAGRRVYTYFIPPSGTPKITKDTDQPADVEWLDQENGVGRFRFLSSETQALELGKWDVEANYAGTDVSPAFYRVIGEQVIYMTEPKGGPLP